MYPLPDRRLSPRDSATHAAEVFGRDAVVEWAEELLAGRAGDMDRRYPDIAWLRGTPGWPSYWVRVWGARALLHLGPARPQVVLGATGDEEWRVREMALKVIAAHRLDDPDGVVDGLVDDPVERVRAQAWRALGRVGSS
ncbi:hypothetical protein [Microbacterium sp. H1-D42]|uniref:HEAT repeat domain-containing protein n=1 Tax=Microbacterium sp. H1-D42 TaxID=2925844 RepID=UPI001F52C461|nr:hypothetical protein [Microbacterium sp. H1-D42]UNK72033.1 hypothetical protein MNR00_06175 [Microbacterium sp. H1-D42]